MESSNDKVVYPEVIVNSRPDRELRKKIIKPGDFVMVPYEDSRCKITVTDIVCINEAGEREVETDGRVFDPSFNGIIIIGSSDSYLDRDFELIVQQMCCGEISEVVMVYKNTEGVRMSEISCKVELNEVSEEQLISDWNWERLYESSVHHKNNGVSLIKQKKITDAFRRFSKALKLLIAIEPVKPNEMDVEMAAIILDLKVKLYNNLAHCQLQYNEYDAARQLCNKVLTLCPDNVKALYRRCTAYMGLKMYEEAWKDIQEVLKVDPNDKSARQKETELRPIIENKKKEYSDVFKKMFSS